MTDRELRDLATALIASQDLAEEYVHLRRIVASAGDLTKEAPSRGFVDRVMRTVEKEPAFVRTAGSPVRLGWAAFAAVLACVLGLFLLRAEPGLWGWTARTFDWVQTRVAAAGADVFQPVWFALSQTYRTAGAVPGYVLVGLTLAAILAAAAVNLWLMRAPREG